MREDGAARPSRRLRVAIYARQQARDHPYFTLFHGALEARGVSVSGDVTMTLPWLKAHRGRIDAVHLHWPESIWRDKAFASRGMVARAVHAGRRLLRLARFLREARRLGVARVWTVHNLEPHEGAWPWDGLGYALVARESDLIICHSRWSLQEVRRQYRVRGRSVVMPMGTLHAAYPPPRAREGVLAGLGLDPRRPVVSCLGRLRGYKGLDLACEAIRRLDGRVQLMIAGPSQRGFDVGPLQEAVRRTPAAFLLARKLTDQEFADVMAASDAVLLPYRTITGSAVLLTALGFGCGVVTADLPYFREILDGEPDAAATVPSADSAAWADAISGYLSRPPHARRQAALRVADRYSWPRCVEPVVEALDAVTASSSARCDGEPLQRASVPSGGREPS